MKKFIYSFIALATTAMTFTSCEDVPMPYNYPTDDEPEVVVTDPEGSGTAADPYNVAAIIQIAENLESGATSTEKYYIKGIISRITEEYSTEYGNATFYISDDGSTNNQFYVYRALYLSNASFKSSDTQIKLGDEVVIYGQITNYNGTIETVQKAAYLYSLNGEGGGADKNTGVAEGDGTLENPFNASAANQFGSKLASGAKSDKPVYIKGKVASIAVSSGKEQNYDSGFGNASFYISEDGSSDSETFYVFRALYLGNKEYTEGDILKVGDEVVVYGLVTNYQGNTPETVQKEAYLYSLNGKTADATKPEGEAKGDGTLENPFNATAANQFASKLAADAKSDKDVYIKGKVSAIAVSNGQQQNYDSGYGNGSFYISDDGSSDSETFYVFRALYLGNKEYTQGDLVKVGDEVIICGKVTNYKGNTPETAQKEAYLYSLNGKTGDDENQDDPTGVTDGVSKTVNGTLVTFTDNSVEEGDETVVVDLNALGLEDKQVVTSVETEDGVKVTFDQGQNGSNAPTYYSASKGVRVYAMNMFTVDGGKPIAKIVLQCDQQGSTAYVGNAQLRATVWENQFIVNNDYTEPKGGVQLRVQTITITYAK